MAYLGFVEYAKSMTKLGNSCVKDPGDQMENRQLLGWDDLNAVFGSIPMVSSVVF
jgi:hypothetical protein